jgi:electron transfer flavoprotein beta subunit
MNIVVTIKQVPDAANVRINPETKTLVREGVESMMNPLDAYALEEGVRLKEKFGGKVTVVCMGPPMAEAVLREAISLGADEAVLLSDRAVAGSDTLATSYALSQTISKLGAFDVILGGKQAIDGDTAQVGPGIAVNLDIPQVTCVRKIREYADNKMVVERMTEEGYDVVEVSLPAVITVVKEINEPRIASLKGKMAAKRAQIKMMTAADIEADLTRLGLKGSPTNVVEIFSPEARKGGVKIEGEPDVQAKTLVASLKEAQLL